MRQPVVSLTHQFYRSVKSSTSCVYNQCGDTRSIEFHHVDPRTKVDTVYNISRTGTVEELIAEMKKCVPLCSEHHKAVHAGRIRGWLKGKFNNGKDSNSLEADHYLPFKPFVTGVIFPQRRFG